MVTTPVFVRAAAWLIAAGVHVAVFVATGHPPPPSASAQREATIATEVALEPVPEAIERSMVPSRAATSSVPQPTHTHAYPVARDHDARPHDPSLFHAPLSLPAPVRETSIVAAPLTPARFTMTVTSDRARVAPAAGSASEPEPGSDALPLAEEGVSSPAGLATPLPDYPAEARAQDVEADVVVAIVVSSAGRVLDAHVIAPAGFGFDEAALRYLRGVARFVPAKRDGRPVAVQMRFSVSFRLH